MLDSNKFQRGRTGERLHTTVYDLHNLRKRTKIKSTNLGISTKGLVNVHVKSLCVLWERDKTICASHKYVNLCFPVSFSDRGCQTKISKFLLRISPTPIKSDWTTQKKSQEHTVIKYCTKNGKLPTSECIRLYILNVYSCTYLNVHYWDGSSD